MFKRCNLCKAAKTRVDFSERQWKKAKKPKCLFCLEPTYQLIEKNRLDKPLKEERRKESQRNKQINIEKKSKMTRIKKLRKRTKENANNPKYKKQLKAALENYQNLFYKKDDDK